MNEPYKSCWECPFCDDLKEHLEVCLPQEQYLERVMEANRAKLKA